MRFRNRTLLPTRKKRFLRDHGSCRPRSYRRNLLAALKNGFGWWHQCWAFANGRSRFPLIGRPQLIHCQENQQGPTILHLKAHTNPRGQCFGCHSLHTSCINNRRQPRCFRYCHMRNKRRNSGFSIVHCR